MSADWLSQLAPAHAPPAPGWWPPAPGWWLLAAIIAALLVAFAWWRLRPQALRRRWALRELRRIRTAGAADALDPAVPADPVDVADSARAIEALLRRYALAVFGHAQVARLSGEAWLRFLQRHGAAALTAEAGHSLLKSAFGGAVRDQRDTWLAGAEAFIRQARGEVTTRHSVRSDTVRSGT